MSIGRGASGAERPLGIGLVGCGWVAQHCHLPAIRRAPHLRLVAATDVDGARRRHVAERFAIPRVYEDVASLLADPAVEAVAVCVPPALHAMVAHHVVAAGKHVFVEKPLALSLDECERLIQAASGSSVVAMVGFNMRFHRLLREARQVIRSGGLGELLAVRTLISSRSRFDGVSPTWTTSLANGGAALTEQAIHHFDLWRFLLEREVAEVFAFARGGATPHKTAAVTARFGDDILATALFSEESSNANEVEIYGRQGRLRVSTFRVDGLELQRSREAAGDLRTRLGSAVRSLRALPRGVRQLQRGGEFMATYHAEWLHFHGAVQHGTPIESTLADGRAALAIALAAVASATSGSPVRPSDAPRDIESAGMTGPRAPD